MTHITQAQPRERGILYQGSMVRALLAGTKTQTRRVAKGVMAAHAQTGEALATLDSNGPRVPCPQGAPGDRLWVREAHYLTDDGHSEYAIFAADGDAVRDHLQSINRLPSDFPADVRAAHIRLRPSIHMPRWASRILLEITEVRVERLTSIDFMHAWAEGVGVPGQHYDIAEGVEMYRALWEEIHGPGSWDANPWVWAISFKLVKP